VKELAGNALSSVLYVCRFQMQDDNIIMFPTLLIYYINLFSLIIENIIIWVMLTSAPGALVKEPNIVI
jgi:hypothetical protein